MTSSPGFKSRGFIETALALLLLLRLLFNMLARRSKRFGKGNRKNNGISKYTQENTDYGIQVIQ